MAAAKTLELLHFYIQPVVTCQISQGSIITCHLGFSVPERSQFIFDGFVRCNLRTENVYYIAVYASEIFPGNHISVERGLGIKWLISIAVRKHDFVTCSQRKLKLRKILAK